MAIDQATLEDSSIVNRLPFNERLFRVRAFRIFLCLEILFLGFPYLAYSESVDALLSVGIAWIVAIVILFVAIPFTIFWKYPLNFCADFLGNHLELPRFFFWKRSIAYENIFSIESVRLGMKEQGVLVGLLSGGVLNLDAKAFQTPEIYADFKDRIDQIVTRNKQIFGATSIVVLPINRWQNLLLLMIIGAWWGVFILLMSQQNISFESALAIGALTKSVLSGVELYRIPSAFFLHLNFLHAGMNTLAFAIFGQYLLRVVDPFRFLNVLFLSALVSAITTLSLSPYEASIGASGGVMGIFGAYCCLKFTRNLPASISSSSNQWVIGFIVLQLAMEFVIDGIDSYAHIGGFFVGLLYLWCNLRDGRNNVFESIVYEKISACLLVALYFGGLAVYLFKVVSFG